MVQFLSAKVKVTERESAVRQIRGVNTSIAGFVGVTERGPIGVATLLTSFAEFVEKFGSYIPDGVLARAVEGFFLNAGEGTPAYFVRTCHYSDITDASTKTALRAYKMLADGAGSPANTLKVWAINEGKWGNKIQITTSLRSRFSTTLNGAVSNGATSAVLTSVEGINIGKVLKLTDGVDTAYVTVTDIQNLRVYFDAITVSGPIADGGAVTEVSFRIQVYESDVQVEDYDYVNLSQTDTVDYVETRINGDSAYITVDDQESASAAPTNRPAAVTLAFLASGADGLASLAATDFVGSSASKTGLYAFDEIQVINLLAIPDSQVQVTQQGLIDYAERRVYPFAVLNSPLGTSVSGMVTYVNSTLAANTSRAAMYYPQIKIADPISGTAKIIPADGHILGLYARTDTNFGVQQVAAGMIAQFRGVIGFENKTTEDEGYRDILYPENINPIGNIEGVGRVPWGSRTLSRAGGIGSQINERRVFAFIQQSLDIGLRWVLFLNNTPELRKQVDDSISGFLIGARTEKIIESFYTDVGEGLNNPVVVNSGKLNALAAFRVPRTTEFMELITTRDTRAEEAFIAANKA